MPRMEEDDIIIGCQCGKNWWMDYQETPASCVGDIWRLGTVVDDNGEGLRIEWGSWVDQDGNSVYVRPSVWTEDALARVIVWLASCTEYGVSLPEDVADCVEWARGKRYE